MKTNNFKPHKTFINFIVERSENDKGLKIEDFKNFFYNNQYKMKPLVILLAGLYLF